MSANSCCGTDWDWFWGFIVYWNSGKFPKRTTLFSLKHMWTILGYCRVSSPAWLCLIYIHTNMTSPTRTNQLELETKQLNQTAMAYKYSSNTMILIKILDLGHLSDTQSLLQHCQEVTWAWALTISLILSIPYWRCVIGIVYCRYSLQFIF